MKTKEITGTSLVREARKNPKLNPKISVNEYISKHYENAEILIKTRGYGDIINSFVSFTEIDKIGINPKSPYNTPLGIYSYPSEYILNLLRKGEPMSELPYAGENPYANIFSVKGNIVDLSTITEREVADYYRKLVGVYIKYAGIKRGSREWKDAVDEFERDIFLAAPKEAKVSSHGGRFWFITMKMAEEISFWMKAQLTTVWNKVFREIGIDGCIDANGDGIIHTSEPIQAVFFSKGAIAENKRVFNRYSPKEIEKAKEVRRHNLYQIKLANTLSDEEIIERIKKYEYPEFLTFIKNPNEQVQLEAIYWNENNIKYIKNPTMEVQKRAVKSLPSAIQHIKNPSEDLQLLAVQTDPDAINYIKNPTERVIKVLTGENNF